MVETKSLQQTQKNWESAISRVPQAYQEGVNAAKGVIQAAIDAEDLYAARLAETIASRKRARALQQVSDEDWRRAASDKGAARIGAGMNAAKASFGTGMAEVLSTIQGVNLPARTADPEQNVINRVLPLVKALHNMKK